MFLIIITAILIVIRFFISIYFDLVEYDQSPFELLNKTSDNWKINITIALIMLAKS